MKVVMLLNVFGTAPVSEQFPVETEHDLCRYICRCVTKYELPDVYGIKQHKEIEAEFPSYLFGKVIVETEAVKLVPEDEGNITFIGPDRPVKLMGSITYTGRYNVDAGLPVFEFNIGTTAPNSLDENFVSWNSAEDFLQFATNYMSQHLV